MNTLMEKNKQLSKKTQLSEQDKKMIISNQDIKIDCNGFEEEKAETCSVIIQKKSP